MRFSSFSFFTAFIYACDHDDDDVRVYVLALIYVFFFFLDFSSLSRSLFFFSHSQLGEYFFFYLEVFFLNAFNEDFLMYDDFALGVNFFFNREGEFFVIRNLIFLKEFLATFLMFLLRDFYNIFYILFLIIRNLIEEFFV